MGELYIQFEYWLAAMQLSLAMLGMGATLTTDDFKDVMREPRSVTVGTAIQLLLVPLVAYTFIHLAGVTGGVAVGIAMIAAIPGGTMSNIFTYIARGNVPLSISITGITTLCCLLTTPLILSLLITEYLPTDFRMPTGQIFKDIVFSLLLPLSLGMLLLYYQPVHATWISKWSIRLSILIIVLIVIGSASAGRLDFNVFGSQNMLQVTLFTLLLVFVSWCASRAFNLSKADRTSVEMEVIVRNINLGLLLKASIFPVVAGGDNQLGDMLLFTIILYGTLQTILAVVLVAARRGRRPVPAGDPQ